MEDNIKNLGISINDLYSEKKQINVHLSDKIQVYTLVLVGRDKTPDFLLSSFSANYYVRSNKGMNRQKYNSIATIQATVKRLINKNIDTKGEIKFSLNNEINYI
jgi:hypothetical protein